MLVVPQPFPMPLLVSLRSDCGTTEETPGRHLHFLMGPQLGNSFNVQISTIHFEESLNFLQG
jgi:hypothetical protein